MPLIHIDWDGPFSVSEVDAMNDPSKDFGLYQFYGQHYVYGSDVLLYIGITEETFAAREKKHWPPERRAKENLPKFYIGKLREIPRDNQFSSLLGKVEKLLIYVHAPAFNSASIAPHELQTVSDLTIYNWGQHRSLLPELSGARWFSGAQLGLHLYLEPEIAARLRQIAAQRGTDAQTLVNDWIKE